MRNKEQADNDILAFRNRISKLEGDLSTANRAKNAAEGESAYKTKKNKELEDALNNLKSKDMVDADQALQWKNRVAALEQELQSLR